MSMDVYKVKDMINCLLLNNQMKIEKEIRMQREGEKCEGKYEDNWF